MNRIYTVQLDGEETPQYMLFDGVNAPSFIYYWAGDEPPVSADDDEWRPTSWQTADARHNARNAAELIFNGEGAILTVERKD